MNTPVLQLNNITRAFEQPDGTALRILTSIDLRVSEGEIVAIVGKSGSGKSTLLNILGLLDAPSSGEMLLDGMATTNLRDADRARLRGKTIGFIFQQFFLMDKRTSLENVAEPMLYGSHQEISIRETCARHLLEQVGLAHRLNAMPNVLSGGEQQRVAIARALVRNPRIVLADEPTGALDTGTSETVLNILFSLARSEGTTLIIVTHDADVAARADRKVELVDGHLQGVNT